MTSYHAALVAPIGQDSFDRQNRSVTGGCGECVRRKRNGIAWAPASNAWEDDNGFYVQVALPGWEPQDVTLEVGKHVLSIKGERARNNPKRPGPCMLKRSETVGSCGSSDCRPILIPEKASAVQKNGLLTVTFPKREEAKSRRIMIEGT